MGKGVLDILEVPENPLEKFFQSLVFLNLFTVD